MDKVLRIVFTPATLTEGSRQCDYHVSLRWRWTRRRKHLSYWMYLHSTYGCVSKPMNINASGVNTHESQLFWCEQKGYKVLTQSHIPESEFCSETDEFSSRFCGAQWGITGTALGRPADHTALLEPIPQSSKHLPRQGLGATYAAQLSLGFQIDEVCHHIYTTYIYIP